MFGAWQKRKDAGIAPFNLCWYPVARFGGITLLPTCVYARCWQDLLEVYQADRQEH